MGVGVSAVRYDGGDDLSFRSECAPSAHTCDLPLPRAFVDLHLALPLKMLFAKWVGEFLCHAYAALAHLPDRLALLSKSARPLLGVFGLSKLLLEG